MIQILGISHQTANLEIREKYAFSNPDIVSFSNTIQMEGEIDELVILSTCNRTEFYFSQNGWTAEKAFNYLLTKLTEFKNLKNCDDMCFYQFTEREAIRHLFKVSSGLDSMLFGEDQIIGQVKEAYIFSTEMGYTDAILMRLFQKSFEAGKRVRSETHIKKGTTSISHLAVEIVQRNLATTVPDKVMVIGSGKAAALVVSALKKKNVAELVIANRSQDNAHKLLNGYSGKVIGLEDIQGELPQCDAVISASGAQRLLISEENITHLQQEVPSKQQVMVDIAVPMSIQKPNTLVPGKKVFVIDDLQSEAKQNAENRKNSLQEAERIIDQVVEEYEQWFASRALRPAIQAITINLQNLSQQELDEFHKGSSPEVQAAMEAYNKHLTQKYTRAFIKNLKEIKDGNHSGNYLDVVERLFKITS